MELKNLIAKNKVIEVEHPALEGFIVSVAYVSRETTRKLLDKATITKYNTKTHKPEEEVDNDLFLKLNTKAIIRNWKGLKFEYLSELVAVDMSEAPEEGELEYSEENALALIKNSTDFDTWLSTILSDVKNFNKSN